MMKKHNSRARGRMRAAAIAAAVCLLSGGLLLFPQSASALTLPVVIRRVMSSNPSVCYPVAGKYYDWIELENTGDEPQSLHGWKLTDTGDLREAYAFEDVALGPGESLVVYCDDAPEGYSGDALFTGFRLSSDGELLLLSDASQRVAALELPPLGKGEVYQLDPDTGAYAALPFDAAMDINGQYAESLTPPYNPGGVSISELMPANRTTLADADDDFSDWIELHNASAQAVSLAGCALSDNDLNRAKWVFPDYVMQPDEYLIVFASGKDRADPQGELHANFKLSKKGEAVRLYNPNGDAISYMEYSVAAADVSFSRQGDGTVTDRLDPSPGYENTALGAQKARANTVENDIGLYINEAFLAGKGSDWVELRNTSSAAVDLSGMGLSDNPGKPRKWQFPEGASLGPGEYLLIELAGSAEKRAEKGPSKGIIAVSEDGETATVTPDYTADFGLSAGESVCLSTRKGLILDRVDLYGRHADISVGRVEGRSGLRYFTQPTPGAANAAESYEKVAKEIAFSVPPGIVRADSIRLELRSDADVPVYYTTDGSEPTPSSKVYREPITLKSNTCVRAIAWREDVLASPEAVASFIFGKHELRLVSVTGSESQLNGSGGVLKSGKKKANGNEVYVEVYEPDGSKLVGQRAVLKMVGHHSRTHYAQKSFKLTAKRATGDTRFRAALFSNRDYDEYKAVVLRAAGQDVFQTKMRDSILTSLAASTSVLYQETEPCVVYINGQYWGLYNMREHIDTHSIAQFEGWSDPDAVNIVEGSGKSSGASAGSSAGYKAMLKWAYSNDLSDDARLEELRSMVDIENYLDYVILEMYTCNQDLNNVSCYSSAEDPRWKWAFFDLDLSYQIDRNNVKDWFSGSVGTITSQDTTLFRALMKNSGMRDYFLTRFGELLADALAAETVTGKIQARYDLIKNEMPANCKRWSWKTDTWNKYVSRMVKYAEERPAKLIGYLADTFNLSDAQKQLYFGDALARAGASL